MNQDEAKKIFLQALPELSEPLKSAVEFMLANWHKLNREPRASDIAINFFASLPALPTNDVDKFFAAKLNEMAKLLRDDPDVWLSLENLPHEVWRDVVGYEGLYKVSNFGRVKSLYFKGGRILRECSLKKHYTSIQLSIKGTYKNFDVHVLVSKAFLPNPKNFPVVHHKDNDKHNTCVWNLEWTTYSENTRTAYRIGTKEIKCGHKNGKSKLNPDQVRYIRKKYVPCHLEFGAKSLAKKFNVTSATIRDVIHYRTHKDIV